jgi:hypothetical protein
MGTERGGLRSSLTSYVQGTVNFECGLSEDLRRRFARHGRLRDRVEFDFRRIMDKEPVFAYSRSFRFSESGKTSDSVLFTIAHLQDEVAQFASGRGLTYMRPLWKSYFQKDYDMLWLHFKDFENAKRLAANFSEQLAIDAHASGSESYVDIVSLSARQVMGATSFSGTPDNPLLFLKEISSNGNTQTVDVIFPSWPFFLYASPRWAAYLLEPLLEHQMSGQYPNAYSMHDLGWHFPNFTGHADGNDEYMPLEECGDMLIMGLSLVNSLLYDTPSSSQSIWATLGKEGDISTEDDNLFAIATEERDGIGYLDGKWGGGSRGRLLAQLWLNKSWKLWDQWTGYLVEFSLEPQNQLSTDDFAGWLALQSNLALKGIVGIKAFSEMAALLGRHGEAKKYQNISETYIEKWEEFATSRDGSHAKLAYNWYGSWTTLYSLFADALLCFHPSKTWEASTSEAPSSEAPSSEAPSMEHDRQAVLELRSEPGSDSSKSDFIPSRVYERQSQWYDIVLQKYGLPLDSRHLYTKSDWEFEAAAVSSPEVRKKILDSVARWVNETVTDRPLTDLYMTEYKGGFPGLQFKARPVVGAHFSFLALERSCLA